MPCTSVSLSPKVNLTQFFGQHDTLDLLPSEFAFAGQEKMEKVRGWSKMTSKERSELRGKGKEGTKGLLSRLVKAAGGRDKMNKLGEKLLEKRQKISSAAELEAFKEGGGTIG